MTRPEIRVDVERAEVTLVASGSDAVALDEPAYDKVGIPVVVGDLPWLINELAAALERLTPSPSSQPEQPTRPPKPQRPNVLMTADFIRAVRAAGLLPADVRTARLVIDAQPQSWVRMYIDQVGDERLLSVVRTLDGIQIMRGDQPA
jgi:hypothetical protein